MSDGTKGHRTPISPKAESPRPDGGNAVRTNVEITGECERVLERFRAGQISRGKAVLALTAAIPESFLGSGAPAESALDAYVDILLSYDRDVATAAKCGRSSAHVDAGGPDEGDGSDADAEVGGDVGSRGGARGKRRKIDESKCAWIANDAIRGRTLRPALGRTLDILREFATDPQAAKSSIINSPSCPGLPGSEWTAIIAGRSVDLDVLLAALCPTAAEDKLAKLGDSEPGFSARAPARSVSTHGEWTTAWRRAAKGMLFAFPHRARELEDYEEHITRLFAAVAPRAHSRVIEFDRAVRERAGSQRNLLLSDYNEFSDLRTCYIEIGCVL